MKVSVIMPLYNKERHIRRAVNAVLGQTHGDFELIVVDDGSTDGSGDRVQAFTDSRIRLVRQDNEGVSAARNRGITEANASLLAFLDSDDEWMPDFLETVLALREKFPEAGAWGTAYTEITPEGQVRNFEPDSETRRRPDGLLINFFRFSLQIQQPCNASSTMMRKDALLKAGGFPEGLTRLGDTDTLFRLALRYPMAYCPVPKAIYHMEAENRSDWYLYSGTYPFFKHAREYLAESPENRVLDEDVEQYVAFYETQSLCSNWLAGNRAAVREIVGECGGLNGYRLTCLSWRVMSWIPYPLVKLGIKLRCRVAHLVGRSGGWPPLRSIHRVCPTLPLEGPQMETNTNVSVVNGT